MKADATSNAEVKQEVPEKRVIGKPFVKGQVPNPNGRPKGSRNKLGEDFLTKLQADFAEHGVATIAKVREDRPHEYLKVVASILPKELNVRTDALNDMSDEDLANILDAVRSALLAGVATPLGSGNETTPRH